MTIDHDTPITPDGREIGRLAHDVIAQLADARDFSPETILRTVGALPALRRVGSYRQAARQRLATAAGVYGRFFWLRHAELEAVELTVPGARLDLLWRDSVSGRCWADEIKTHRLLDLLADDELCDQLRRQVAGGAQRLDHFLGVRTCIVAAPRESVLWRPDGQREDAAQALEALR